MKRLILKLLSILFYAMEFMGFLFVYALAAYAVTDGAMVGKLGVVMMLIASALSTIGLLLAILKWGE